MYKLYHYLYAYWGWDEYRHVHLVLFVQSRVWRRYLDNKSRLSATGMPCD